MSDNNSTEIIRFGANNPTLEDYQSVFWDPGTTKYIEFYANKQVSVTVVDIDNPTQLSESLSNLIDGHPMSIDFEWKPDTFSSNNPISLFQIGSSKGVVIVLNSQKIICHGKDYRSFDFFNECPEGLTIMKEFLNSNLFYGKGMSCDKKKLKQLFDQIFLMEDIDTTRLHPHELTSNFSDLVTQLIGEPDAKFKDQNISRSNWNNRPLTVKQVLYAAFDAYATRLFLNYFVNKYGEDEFIDPSTIVIEKTTKKSKKQKTKNKQTTTTDNDTDNSKKNKSNDSINLIKQNQKDYKPKFNIKVKFDQVDNYLYLLDNDEITNFGYGFDQIKKDSDNYVESGIIPSGYNPRTSLKRRILCLQDIIELPGEIDNPNYYCKICKENIDSASLDSHIWMKHFDQIPYVYFPDQVPSYIVKCLHTIFVACSNFKFCEDVKENVNEESTKDETTDNDNDDDDKNDQKKEKESHKNESTNKVEKNNKNDNNENKSTKNDTNSNSDDDKNESSKEDVKNESTNNDTSDNNNSNDDKNESSKKDDKDESTNNDTSDNNDAKEDQKSGEENADIYALEKEVICTLCDHHFPSFGTFFAHIQHMHSKIMFDHFTKNIKEVLFLYLTKIGLFDTSTRFCSICNQNVEENEFNDSDIDHCWRFHGEEIVKMLKHRPNRYSESCFTSCFPWGVTSIHPMNSGQMYKGSISCSFCKIGFDDPGELFVHLFHRHTNAIAVKKSDTFRWPLRASDLHPEFLEIMEKWCFLLAVNALADENVRIIEEIEEVDQKEVDDQSKKDKKKKKKKKNKFFNKILYRCNECKDENDNFEEFHSPKQLWNHIVKNHLIIVFDHI